MTLENLQKIQHMSSVEKLFSNKSKSSSSKYTPKYLN